MMKMPCVGFWKLKAYFKLIVDIKILMNCTLSEKAVWEGGGGVNEIIFYYKIFIVIKADYFMALKNRINAWDVILKVTQQGLISESVIPRIWGT